MADRAAILDSSLNYLVVHEFAKTGGLHGTAGTFATLEALANADTAPDDGTDSDHSIDIGGTDRGAIKDAAASGLYDWFDAVHLLPRTAIDFGNIVTTVSVEFEIFNAYRTAVSLIDFDNNAGAGVTIPELPIPVAELNGFTSFLSATSTRLSPDKMTIDASAVGPATFDDYLLFTFSPGGILALRVLGSRVALIFVEFDGEVTERLRWLTTINRGLDGVEQRIAERRHPRQEFDVVLATDGDDRRRLENLFFGWRGRSFGLPLWHDDLRLSAAASSGAFSVSVASTSYCDLREGGLAVVLTDSDTYDVLEISTVGASSITFATALQSSHAAGARVMPVRLVIMREAPRLSIYPVNELRISCSFAVIENEIGAPAGSLAGWSTLNGAALLDRNFVAGDSDQGSLEQEIVVHDGDLGLIDIDSLWLRSAKAHSYGFRAMSRAALWSIRELLLYQRGRQRSAWIASAHEDMIVVENVTSGSNQLRIEHQGYSRFVAALQPRATIRITFTDGSQLTRTITAASEFDATKETLTLDANWPANRTVAEFERVEFVEPSRLDSDDVEIVHTATGYARLQVPVRVLFTAP